MGLDHIFQLTSIPSSAMLGHYNWSLVNLSYFIASLASFVALDLTERIRTSGETTKVKIGWLIVGAFAMGMGIWTMHFIGMLAFIMPVPMDYDHALTGLSLVIAIVASAFAFFVIKNEHVAPISLIMGGILLGLGIVSMHYTGMAAMLHVQISYIPSIFILSILIAIAASEAALWLMIKSSQKINKYHSFIKIGSALIMGLAICGMHYTGMAAAVFVHDPTYQYPIQENPLSVDTLSFYIATMTIIIMAIALIASRFWMNTLQSRNKKLLEAEAIVERKNLELQRLNQNLSDLAETLLAREERTHAILTAAADGIIMMNESGIIEVCNQAASKLFGYASEEIVSQNIIQFMGAYQLEENKFQVIPLSFFIEQRDTLVELIGISKNNNIFPLELTISKSIVKENIIYIIVFRDITERKQAEQKLTSLHYQLVSTAHLAGKAEVATGVLHSVGNIFNSINVSIQILLKREWGSKISGLSELSKLLNMHKNNLNIFMNSHPIGKILPEYVEEFTTYIRQELTFIYKELETLNTKTQHIKTIISMQQSIAKDSTMLEKVQVDQILEEALVITSENIEKHGIIIERNYEKIPAFDIDKIKLIQTLINLIQNAIDAVLESNNKTKQISLQIMKEKSGNVHIKISDNGIGISQENLKNIFSYGFTTKKHGHGFGLHTSALALQEVGGSLQAYSAGINQGATFIIILPKPMDKKESNLTSIPRGQHGQ